MQIKSDSDTNMLREYATIIIQDLTVLDNPGKVSHKVAESFALSEFEKYRITQDKLFESDFDKFMIEMENEDISC